MAGKIHLIPFSSNLFHTQISVFHHSKYPQSSRRGRTPDDVPLSIFWILYTQNWPFHLATCHNIFEKWKCSSIYFLNSLHTKLTFSPGQLPQHFEKWKLTIDTKSSNICWDHLMTTRTKIYFRSQQGEGSKGGQKQATFPLDKYISKFWEIHKQHRKYRRPTRHQIVGKI